MSFIAATTGMTKEASDKGFKKALVEAGIPGDFVFFTDGKERATVSTGDWHEQNQCDAAYEIGKKFFKQWETPDDSEIGRPSWATTSIKSGVKTEDALQPVQRKCSRCGSPSKHEQCGACDELDRNDSASVDHSNDPLFSQQAHIEQRLGPEGRCAHGVRTPYNDCPECGTKSAKLREDKLERLRQRRGECEHCGTPNQEPFSACKCLESSGGSTFARFGISERYIPFDKKGSAMHSQNLTHGCQPQVLRDVLLHAVRNKSAKHDVTFDVAEGGVDSVDAHMVGMTSFQTTKAATVGSVLSFMNHGEVCVKAATALRLPQRHEILDSKVTDPAALAAARLHVTQKGSKSAAQRLGALGAPFSLGLPATGSTTPLERSVGSPKVSLEVRKRAGVTAAAAFATTRLTLRGDAQISSDGALAKLAGEVGEPRKFLKGGRGHPGLMRLGVASPGYTDEIGPRNEPDRFGRVVDPITKVADDMAIFSDTPFGVQGECVGGVMRELEKIGIYIGHKPHPNPSVSQIQANNYRLGHANIQGLDISIENAKGGVRRGVDPDGKAWESKMHAPYGYVRSVAGGESGKRVFPKAVDGDAVDVFIGPDLASEFVVAIDQYKGDKFDESKFVLGCHSKDEATALYLSHYPSGWKLGPTSTTTIAQFKLWLRTKGVLKPFAGQTVKAASTMKPFHDWDGTVIPRIPGNAKAYLQAIGVLTPEDVLPDGRGHEEPIDIATSRPPLFHHDIRSTAARLGVPVGEIHHAKGDKTEFLRSHNRPIIDDDASIRDAVRRVLGESYAIAPQDDLRKAASDWDWGWAAGGQAAGGLTVAGLLHAYSKLITAGAGAPADREDRGVMRNLKDGIRNTPEFQARHSITERLAARRGDPSAAAKFLRAAGISRDPGGASYDSTTGKINLSKGQAGPALLAHEMGHKAGPKALLHANSVGKVLSSLGTFSALADPDQDSSRAEAIVGTLGGAGTLASEIDASRRGYNLLRGAGSSKMRALKAFIGVPTYALTAGLPALAYQIKKHSGGFAPPAPEPVKQASRIGGAMKALGLAQAPLLGEQVAQKARQGVSIFNMGDRVVGGPLGGLLRGKGVIPMASGVATPAMQTSKGVAVDFAGSLAPGNGYRLSRGVKNVAPRTAAQDSMLSRVGGDKLLEAQKFKGLLPETTQLSALAAKHGVDPTDSQALYDLLNRQYGGKFIVKPRAGAATSGSALPSDVTGPERLKEVLGNGMGNRYGINFKTDAKNMVAQPRLDLEPLSRFDRAANNITEMVQQRRWGGLDAATGKSKLPFAPKGSMSAGSGNEYRLHVVDGKVVPYATMHRGSVTGLLPWHSRGAGQAEKAIQAQLDGLKNKNLKGTFGFDVARERNGNWRVIETNPTDQGGSGLMQLPHMQDAVAAALQGRLPNYIKMQRGIQGLGLGALGAGTMGMRSPENTEAPVS